jgi:hypothetical protein
MRRALEERFVASFFSNARLLMQNYKGTHFEEILNSDRLSFFLDFSGNRQCRPDWLRSNQPASHRKKRGQFYY